MLIIIFILALVTRFLYFPDNVYFAYDQARDAFNAQEILKGDLKIIGPPSGASDKLFPGPLAYYVYAPIYFISGKSPETVGAFLRITNALGIFFVFAIGSLVFNRYTGLIAALLFALSYEQTQYSLFISHQPLAIISVLLFYLGLALFLLKKKQQGILLTALGWGLSIQFHYLYILLAIPILLLLIFLRKQLWLPKVKWIILSIAGFTLTLATYIISELKFGFRISSTLFQMTQGLAESRQDSSSLHLEAIPFILNRFLHDNIASASLVIPFVWISLGIFTLYLIKQKDTCYKILFLLIWLFGGLPVYILTGTPSYYYSAAASVPLLILVSYASSQIMVRKYAIGILLLILVIFSNLNLIKTQNPNGPNSDIVIQPGMLLVKQMEALDYMYSVSDEKEFTVNALTIPFNINTTWSYLFEWYGGKTYGYLPVWSGNAAAGYPGNLTTINNRSNLPEIQFLIIEPNIGIPYYIQEDFLREEGYFTKVTGEKKFGTITVQVRQKI